VDAPDISGNEVATDNFKDELYAATAKHRIWISRLKDLPGGTFEIIVKRLMQGDSKLAMSKWLANLNSEYSAHSYRKFLTVLDVDIQGLITAKEKAIETQMEIDAHRDKLVKIEIEKHLNKQMPEVPSAKQFRRLDATVDEQVMNLDAERMLRYAWVTQQRRVDSMVAMEQQMGFLHRGGDREMKALTHIASELMKFRLLRETLYRKFGRENPVIDSGKRKNGIVDKFKTLDDVDQHLIIQLQRQFKDLALENLNAPTTEGLGTDARGTSATETGDNPADRREIVTSGT
jgi:hypothetical protein